MAYAMLITFYSVCAVAFAILLAAIACAITGIR